MADMLRLAVVRAETRGWKKGPLPAALTNGPHTGACVASYLTRIADAAIARQPSFSDARRCLRLTDRRPSA